MFYEERFDELYHYGIEGMKWGVRRGPPYPLDSKKAGAPALKVSSLVANRAKHLAAIIGWGAVSAAVGIIPTEVYLMNDIIKKRLDKKDYVKKDGEIEKVSKLKKQKQKTSTDENLKLVNPGNGFGKVNNCVYCVAGMELRERGYDVKARRKGQGMPISEYKNWFKGVKFEHLKTERNWKLGISVNDARRGYTALCEKLEKFPKGSRGVLSLTWLGMNKTGHVVNWKIEDDGVNFYDAQDGKKNDMMTFFAADQNYSFARLDNCPLMPGVTEAVISREDKNDKSKSSR